MQQHPAGGFQRLQSCCGPSFLSRLVTQIAGRGVIPEASGHLGAHGEYAAHHGGGTRSGQAHAGFGEASAQRIAARTAAARLQVSARRTAGRSGRDRARAISSAMRARSDAPGPGGPVLVRVLVASHSRFARDISRCCCCCLACWSLVAHRPVSPLHCSFGGASWWHRQIAVTQSGRRGSDTALVAFDARRGRGVGVEERHQGYRGFDTGPNLGE